MTTDTATTPTAAAREIIEQHVYQAFARDLIARHKCQSTKRNLKKDNTERMIAEARYAALKELTAALTEAGFLL